jgi:hypothetical protein
LAAVVVTMCALALPVGSAVATPQVTGPGTGPQPKGQGLGSAAALAGKFCTENGRTSFNIVGGGPFCVNPWPAGKSNGGATAPGVTAKEVKVVAYIPNEQQAASGTGAVAPKNQATGARAKIADTITDYQKVYDYAEANLGTFQLWGRKPTFEVMTQSGADETAQRADALEVINKKPFMVVDMTGTSTGGAPVFSSTVAARKIVVVSASTTAKVGAQQSPYRWNYGADNDAGAPLTAAFVGRSLAGKKAQWAGDQGMTSKTRSFGVVYPTTGFDLNGFQSLLKQNGGPKIAQAVGFDPTNPAQVADQAPTLVTKLKSSGVTSVIAFADNALMAPLTKAATNQEYSPEWVFTGYGYQDFDGFARTYDQDQMKHAFGLSVLAPYTANAPDYLDVFNWYWSKTQGNTFSITGGMFNFVYYAMHYAGPTLTADNLRKGLFSAPAVGGAATGSVAGQSGFGKTVGLPYDSYALLGSDRGLAYWNPDVTASTQAINVVGKGVFMYLDGGKRYGYKDFAKTEPKFFDANGAVSEAPIGSLFPSGKVSPASPCTECPSNGATG